MPAVAATTDSAAIAQGRYLAYSTAGCAYCHLPKADWARLDAGEQPPLSGNHIFPLPFAEIHSPNLTPDPTTGIGRRSDGEIARILRHGVRADNRAAFPFMEFQNLSDADVVALLSFLRSQPPVENAVPQIDYNLMGKALMALMIKPESPVHAAARGFAVGADRRARRVPRELGVELRVVVTPIAATPAQYIGRQVRGGQVMDIEDDPTHVYVTPNLTPGSRDRPHPLLVGGGFRRAFPRGPAPAGGADALGRILPDDRGRPARDLPLPALAAAERQPRGRGLSQRRRRT